MELNEEEFLLFNTRSREQLLLKDGFIIHLFEKSDEVIAVFQLYGFIVEAKTGDGGSLYIKTAIMQPVPDEYLEMIVIEEFY